MWLTKSIRSFISTFEIFLIDLSFVLLFPFLFDFALFFSLSLTLFMLLSSTWAMNMQFPNASSAFYKIIYFPIAAHNLFFIYIFMCLCIFIQNYFFLLSKCSFSSVALYHIFIFPKLFGFSHIFRYLTRIFRLLNREEK